MTGVSGRQVLAMGKQVVSIYRKAELSGIAQQTAYNILFALGPLLISVVALAGLITRDVNSDKPNPADPVINWVYEHLPRATADFFQEPLKNALTTSPTFLLSFGGLITLWGAKGAMGALMRGLNDAYEVEEHRSWLVQQLVAIGLTIVVGVLIAFTSLIFVLGTSAGNSIANGIGLGHVWNTFSQWTRWPVIVVVSVIAIALLHRYAQNYHAPFHFFLPGAIFTVIAIVLSAIALQIYFSRFGSYNEVYGTFGSVLAFIFWVYVIALVILLGGAINLAAHRVLEPAESAEATEAADREAPS
jgi:membrane protein